MDDDVVDNGSDDTPLLADSSHELHIEQFDDLDLTGGWSNGRLHARRRIASNVVRRTPRPKYIHYFCGCDLGRKRDPSILAIIEVQHNNGRTYIVYYLKCFTLSMLYANIAAKLVKTDMSLKRIAARKGKEAIISYVLDATGLGAPICELVEKAFPLADIKRVYIIRGINTTEGSSYNEYHVPAATHFGIDGSV